MEGHYHKRKPPKKQQSSSSLTANFSQKTLNSLSVWSTKIQAENVLFFHLFIFSSSLSGDSFCLFCLYYGPALLGNNQSVPFELQSLFWSGIHRNGLLGQSMTFFYSDQTFIPITCVHINTASETLCGCFLPSKRKNSSSPVLWFQNPVIIL